MHRPARHRPAEQIQHAVVFSAASHALHGARVFGQRGYWVKDAFTPYPVHGMDQALRLPPSRISHATLIGGLIGGSMGLSFQIWSHTMDWPLNIGGKSLLAWQGLMPVTFELIILLAAIFTVVVLLFRSSLRPRWSGEKPPTQPHARVSDDHFVLVVSEHDGSFSIQAFRDLCHELGADTIIEGYR